MGRAVAGEVGVRLIRRPSDFGINRIRGTGMARGTKIKATDLVTGRGHILICNVIAFKESG